MGNKSSLLTRKHTEWAYSWHLILKWDNTTNIITNGQAVPSIHEYTVE